MIIPEILQLFPGEPKPIVSIPFIPLPILPPQAIQKNRTSDTRNPYQSQTHPIPNRIRWRLRRDKDTRGDNPCTITKPNL